MKIDLHVHTGISPSGTPCLEDLQRYLARTHLVERAREAGLDGLCITEHDRVWPPEIVRAMREELEFPIFGGVEVSTNYAEYGHVLVFGLLSYVPGIWDMNKLAQVARDAGAFLSIAHPFREQLVPRYPGGGSMSFLGVDEAMAWPVFQQVQGLEVFNGGTLDRENRFACEVCARLGLKGTGGSDAHSANGIGTGITIFEDEIRDEAELVEALHGGRFKAASSQRHTGYREFPEAAQTVPAPS